MADAFIHRAEDICREELKAIHAGGDLLNEMDYAWSSALMIQ